MTSEKIVINTKPVAEDEWARNKDWITYQDKYIQTTGEEYKTEAKTFGTIFTAIFSIYVTLLTFYGLSSKDLLFYRQVPYNILYFIPIIFWICGIVCFLMVNRPITTYVIKDSSESFRDAINEDNLEKRKWLSRGIISFAIGVAFISFAIIIGSSYVPVSVPKDVQFIVTNDSLPILNEIPLNFINDTHKTTSVKLLNSSDTSYTVQLNNGNIVDLDKKWIKTIIVISNT